MANVWDTILGVAGIAHSAKSARQTLRDSRPVDTFGPHREHYANKLREVMDNPAMITEMPGYKFGLDQGLTATHRRLQGGGYGGSGNEAIALNEYAQDYASKSLGGILQQLAMLSGAGIAPQGGSLDGHRLAYGQGMDAMKQLGYLATDLFDDEEETFQGGQASANGVMDPFMYAN